MGLLGPPAGSALRESRLCCGTNPPPLREAPSLYPLATSKRGSRVRARIRHLIAAAMVVGIGVSGCVSIRLDPIPAGIRVYRPERQEESDLWLTAAEFDRVVADAGLLYEDEILEAYLAGVLARIQAAGGMQHVVRVFVIRHPHRNAFALPNGSLYLHSGMVTALENEAQVATVLAHELAHFQGRHSAREHFADQNRGRAKTALRVLLGAATAAAGDPRLGIALADGVSGTTRALVAMTIGGYSKRLEREADQVGLERVAAAGYPVAQAEAVFEHLKRELDEAGAEEPGLFGTHPTLDARIESARAFLAERPDTASGNTGVEAHQSAIHRVALVNAELDLAIGRHVFARSAVERHLDQDPRSAAGTLLLGEIQRRSADADEAARAAQSFARAAALDPTFAAPERALGMLYRRRGDHDRASQHFAAALARDPGLPDAEILR